MEYIHSYYEIGLCCPDCGKQHECKSVGIGMKHICEFCACRFTNYDAVYCDNALG